MITETMKKWLETEYPEFLKRKRGHRGYRGSVKFFVYLNRIQNRIERELNYTLWLALNRPDILSGKAIVNEYGHIRADSKDRSYERMKTLMLVLKALMKKENVNVELIKHEQDS